MKISDNHNDPDAVDLKTTGGVIVIDKPPTMSSMTAVAIIRRKSGVKAGHAGTLDPLASGVLVIGVGKATKSLERFMKTRKIYRTIIDLSAFTPTDDREGEKEIIGTPWLYQTEILKLYSFNEKMNYSDDTELCHRLRKDNHSIGISNIKSYEIGENNFPELKLRWLNYGASDSEYFRMFKKDWHIFQQINSLLSPLKKDFIKIVFSSRILIFQKIYILPFLLYITFVRYIGWIKAKKRF